MKNLIIFLLLAVWFLITAICCVLVIPMAALSLANGTGEWFDFPKDCINKLS